MLKTIDLQLIIVYSREGDNNYKLFLKEVVILKRQQLIDYRGERSQEKMGNMYGVTQQSWSKWERGAASPSLAVMKKIEIDSGISMEVIFFDSFNNLKLLKTRISKAS